MGGLCDSCYPTSTAEKAPNGLASLTISAMAGAASGRRVAFSSPANQRRAMAFCVCQQDRFTDADFNPAPARFDNIKGAVVDAVSWSVSPEDYEVRLKALLQSDAWRLSAYWLLRDASHSMTRLIGRWSPVLAASSNGVGVLTLMSGQAASLDDLHRRLDEFPSSGVIPPGCGITILFGVDGPASQRDSDL